MINVRIPRWHQVRIPLLLAASTCGGALALLGQDLAHLRTVVIGLGGDPYQTLWRFSALTDALARGTFTISEDPIRNFGPLPWLPMHLLFGEPLGYNSVWILQFPLAALATYGFARLLNLGRGSAALAGFLVAYAPYRIAQSLGHFGAMQLFWIPLALAALLWFLRRPTPARALCAAAAFVGTAWTEHVLFLTTLFGALILIAVHRHHCITVVRTRRGVSAAVLGLLSIVAFGILPFRGEVQRVARSDSQFNLGTEQRLRFAPSAATLLLPSRFHALRFADDAYGTARQAVADHTHTLGLFAVLLAGVGAWQLYAQQRKQEALLLGGLAAGGVLLALAARSSLGATILNELPIVSAVRTVNRFLALTSISVPILASISLRWFPRRIALGLAALLLVEVLPMPFPVQDATIPAAFAALAPDATGRLGPLLEIPAATDYLVSSRAQYFTTQHRRPILASNVFERVADRETREAPLRIPGIGALLSVQPERLSQPTVFGQHPKEILHAALTSEGVPAVIVHERVLGFPTLRSSPRGLTVISPETFALVHAILRDAGFHGEPIGDATLYRIPPWPETRSAFVAVPERGIDAVEGTNRVRIRSGATMSIHVVGRSTVPVTLAFHPVDPSLPRTELRGPSGSILVTPNASGAVRVSLGALSPGAHAFVFALDGTQIFVENLSVTNRTQ